MVNSFYVLFINFKLSYLPYMCDELVILGHAMLEYQSCSIFSRRVVAVVV